MQSEIAKRKEDLARCEDALEACVLARDLAHSYLASDDLIKARHYLLVAGLGFVREGDVYHAIAVLCDFKEIADADEQIYQLKTLIADTFSVRREKKKDIDAEMPLPTPFQEFTASVSFDDANEEDVQRSQIGGPSNSSFELLSSLRVSELSVLLEIATNRKLSAGDELYSEGTSASHFYIVASGEIVLTSKSGGRRIVGESEFFADLSYFSGVRRGASAVAKNDAEVLEFVGAQFIESFKKFPNLQERVWYFFEKRLFLNIASRYELFEGLTPKEIITCYEYFTPVNVPAGRVILREGAHVERLHFIGQGQCETVKKDKEKSVYRVGQFIAEREFLTSASLPNKVVAATDAYILELRRELFEKLCQSIPRLEKNKKILSDRNAKPRTTEEALID